MRWASKPQPSPIILAYWLYAAQTNQAELYGTFCLDSWRLSHLNHHLLGGKVLELGQEHLLAHCRTFLIMEAQHLEQLATEDLVPRLSLEPGLQPTKLQRLLLQYRQSHLVNRLNLNPLNFSSCFRCDAFCVCGKGGKGTLLLPVGQVGVLPGSCRGGGRHH